MTGRALYNDCPLKEEEQADAEAETEVAMVSEK